MAGFDCSMQRSVSQLLSEKGIAAKSSWLEQCLNHIMRQGVVRRDPQVLAEKVFEIYLDSDLYEIGLPLLPDNIDTKPPHILTGPLVLQIDEVANIGQSLMQQKAAAESGIESTSQKRMLKLYLTDGVRTIIAAEEHFIASLSAKTPAGGKLLLQNVKVHRGLLLLSPACVQLLGGEVERLLLLQQRANSADSESSTNSISDPPRARLDGMVMSPLPEPQSRNQSRALVSKDTLNGHIQHPNASNSHPSISQPQPQRQPPPPSPPPPPPPPPQQQQQRRAPIQFPAAIPTDYTSGCHFASTHVNASADVMDLRSDSPSVASEHESVASPYESNQDYQYDDYGNFDNSAYVDNDYSVYDEKSSSYGQQRREEVSLTLDREYVSVDDDLDFDDCIPPPPAKPTATLSSSSRPVTIQFDEEPIEDEEEKSGCPSEDIVYSPDLVIMPSQPVMFKSFKELLRGLDTCIDMGSFKCRIHLHPRAILKFKAQKSGFLVRMNFEDDSRDVQSLFIANDLCEIVVGQSVAEYRKAEKSLSKEGKHQLKIKTCDRFKIIKGLCSIVYNKVEGEDGCGDAVDASFLSGGGDVGCSGGSQAISLPLNITSFEKIK